MIVHVMRHGWTLCGVYWPQRPEEWVERADVWVSFENAKEELAMIKQDLGDTPCPECESRAACR